MLTFAPPIKQPLVYNFNSGPSVLPKEVFAAAAEAVLSYKDSGLSILELGHRTSYFLDIMEESRSLMREHMQLAADHEVLFLHGGASTQFMQVPMNLLGIKESAAFTDTGIWASKAIKEAKLFGKAEVVCSSKDANYSYIPQDYAVPNDSKYLHITSNETVFGTQWKSMPNTSVPLVADMSSDILSRVIDYNKFDLIYAGAQKNIGAAGVTVVIVNKNALGKVRRTIPTMMDYRNHIAEGSILNTPPVFAVYSCLLNLRWLKSFGGVAAAEKLNAQKSQMLYAEIDRNPLFEGTAAVKDRSAMNVCFRTKSDGDEAAFLKLCKENGMVGIKGYRLVGGFRASLYNALPLDAVQALVDLMRHFEQSR